jgi:hypothetical protein
VPFIVIPVPKVILPFICKEAVIVIVFVYVEKTIL